MNLSKRQREVVALIQQGKQNKEIAAELGVSLETVKTHVKRALYSTCTYSRRELAAKAEGN